MFRFSIRDLLWLTVVVALGVAWWLHHRGWVQKYSETAHDREIWQARTEQLQVRTEILAEQLRGKSVSNPSAPTPSLPKK